MAPLAGGSSSGGGPAWGRLGLLGWLLLLLGAALAAWLSPALD